MNREQILWTFIWSRQSWYSRCTLLSMITGSMSSEPEKQKREQLLWVRVCHSVGVGVSFCGCGCVILWVRVCHSVGAGVSFCGCGCENWCVCFFVNLYCHRFTPLPPHFFYFLCTASGSDDHQPFRQVYFKWACLIFRQKNWPITACLIFQQKNWPITACLMS